jgi:SAM-dependent methyltransferase
LLEFAGGTVNAEGINRGSFAKFFIVRCLPAEIIPMQDANLPAPDDWRLSEFRRVLKEYYSARVRGKLYHVSMPSTIDSYLIAAKYYDSAYAAMGLVDAPFYVDLAKETGGPVLEIGCGTGRVLLATARAGIKIHGVDNSAPMLAVLRERIAHESATVQKNITLHAGDMRDFRLNRTFALVTIPFRPMQQLFTVRDQLAALTSAAAHVAEGGTLAFDVFYPKNDVSKVRIGEERLEAEWSPASDPEMVIRRYVRTESVDKIAQNYALTFFFRTYRNGQMIAEETDTLKMSYYTYPHLQALFLLAGLETVAEYGSFAKTPLDNTAEEMIFLLRPKR